MTLGRIALDYVAAATRDSATPKATEEFRATMLGALLRWAGEETPVVELSVGFLREYGDSLPGEGRKAVTRHRKVREAELLWAWAHDDPDRYPGVPVPRRITDRRRPSSVRQPAPVVALARPTWGDLDAVIGRMGGDRARWHARLATVLRYTALLTAPTWQDSSDTPRGDRARSANDADSWCRPRTKGLRTSASRASAPTVGRRSSARSMSGRTAGSSSTSREQLRDKLRQAAVEKKETEIAFRLLLDRVPDEVAEVARLLQRD